MYVCLNLTKYTTSPELAQAVKAILFASDRGRRCGIWDNPPWNGELVKTQVKNRVAIRYFKSLKQKLFTHAERCSISIQLVDVFNFCFLKLWRLFACLRDYLNYKEKKKI